MFQIYTYDIFLVFLVFLICFLCYFPFFFTLMYEFTSDNIYYYLLNVYVTFAPFKTVGLIPLNSSRILNLVCYCLLGGYFSVYKCFCLWSHVFSPFAQGYVVGRIRNKRREKSWERNCFCSFSFSLFYFFIQLFAKHEHWMKNV